MSDGCPFCPPAVDGETSVLSNELCIFMLYQDADLERGGMIIARAHRPTLFDLTAEEWAASFALLQGARTLIDSTYAPQGYNVGWNCGATGGQHVFHAHMHVLPRFADEPLAGKGIRYWLKQPENQRPPRSD